MSKRSVNQEPTLSQAHRAARLDVIRDDQLLYSRAQVQRMLGGISYISVIRLEKAGRLKPVRLHPNKTKAQVYYRHADVFALAEGQ